MQMTALFALVFFMSTGYGIVHGTQELRGLRAAWGYPAAILTWTAKPFDGIRHEGMAWVVLFIHWLAFTTIVLANLGQLLETAVFGLSLADFFDSSDPFPIGWLLVVSFAIIAFFWGRTLLTPFGNPFAGPGYYQLAAEGIVYAGHLFPWQAFSHFTAGERGGPFRLWAAASPGIVLLAFTPMEAIDRRRLRQELSRYVNDTPPSVPVTNRPEWVYPAAMILLSSGAVAASLLMLRYLGPVGLVGNLFLVYFFMTLGGGLMMQFGYGGYAQKLHPEGPRSDPPSEA